MTIAKFEVCVACACVLVSAPALEKVGDIPVPADGLVVHIDAMTDAALAYHPDGGNYVTNWTSSVGGVNYGNVGAVEGLPYYDPNGMSEGRGAVIFGYANDGATKRPTWISANKSYGMKTVFLLMRLIERGDSNPVQCIDKDGYEQGGILLASHAWGVYNRGIVQHGWLWYDDEQKTSPEATDISSAFSLPSNARTTPHVFTVVNDEQDNPYEGTWSIGDTTHGTTAYSAKRCPRIAVGELLIYDRPVTEQERRWVINALYCKWFDDKGDAILEWSAENPPVSSASAYVIDGSVDVTGAVAVKNLYLSGATVNLKPGSELEILMSGALSEIKLGDSPAASTLAFCGGSLAVAKDVTIAPTAVTLSGSGRKAGEGTLKLLADVDAAGAAFSVDGGLLDLNGRQMSLREVTGTSVGCVTNTADGQATLALTPTASSDALLAARVAGNVRVTREEASAGSFGLVGNGLSGVQLELGSGASEIVTNRLPVLDGCVFDMDASAMESVVTNADGQVLVWQSRHDPTYSFRTNTDHETSAALHPWYDKTAFDGIGGVRFGYTLDASAMTATFLKGDRPVNIWTFFFVMREDTSAQYQDPFGSMGEDKVLFRDLGTGNGNFSWECPCEGGDTWMNGQLLYSEFVTPPYTNEQVRANASNGLLGLYKAKNDPKFGATELLGVRRKNSEWRTGKPDKVVCPSIGGQRNVYVDKRFFRGWIGEAVAYDRILSDEEFKRVQKYLADKWRIVPREEPPAGGGDFAHVEALELKGGVALDLNGTEQSVPKVAVVGAAEVSDGTLLPQALETQVAADGSFGALTLDAGLDLTDIDFAFGGDGTPRPNGGTILSAKEQVAGPFKSVVAPRPEALRYQGRKVSYGCTGLLLFLR